VEAVAVSLIVLAVVIGGWLAVKWRHWLQRDDVRESGRFRGAHSRVGGTRCHACRAAVVEEDSRFCPRCGERLGVPIGS
jgi:rubrerythrin